MWQKGQKKKKKTVKRFLGSIPTLREVTTEIGLKECFVVVAL